MKLNFSNEIYKQKAYEILNDSSDKELISMEKAFLVLIHDIPITQLDNLCKEISVLLNISIEDAYNLTQNIENNEYSIQILECAYEMVRENKNFGSEKTEDGKFNKSSWLNHSFNNAIACYNISKMLDLDSKKAFTYGLLHDYGRKYSHTFEHVTKGFEGLIDLGLENEARGCLTHSFINKGRYLNNEIPGETDEMTYVLGGANYTIYDDILNVADLIATNYGITSPLERVNDIATRRPNIDNAPNRKAFLIAFYNLLKSIILKIDKNINLPDISTDYDLGTIKLYFEMMSKIFYSLYTENNNVIDFTEKKRKK